jgi:vacuolar-type H+-ATPase subunit E/Vma4
MLSEQSQTGITGAIIQRIDKRVLCDNSFQAILQRQQNELRLLIAQELFGEIEEM